jgi:predicted heme/steroid binding protein
MREFTRKELRRYDGTNGMPAFVAYKGTVYDVTRSFLWQGGTHQVVHAAGEDLTAAMEDAPHGDEVMTKFPVVGILVKSKEQTRPDRRGQEQKREREG